MAVLQIDELINAYINEKSARRLLPYNHTVDAFNAQIKAFCIDPAEHPIVKMVRELENERIKYFVKEYLMVRLDKILANVFLNVELMSPGEKQLYEEWLSLLAREDTLGGEVSEEPEYVGFFCTKSLGNVMIDDQVLEIFEGDFFVANIDDIAYYLKGGDVLLA